MTEKKEYFCATCNNKIPGNTAKSCEKYDGLDGKYYCKEHKEQILREKGYACECGILVTEKARDFSLDRYGKVLCYNCQKKDNSEDQSLIHVETLPPLQNPSNALIVRPAMTAEESLSAWHEFQELKANVKSSNDIIQIRGNEYLKKSFWRKMATFFNLTDEIITREVELDNKGKTRTAYYEVRVVHPNGRSVVGIGFCSAAERNFAHPDHDIRAVANTRAKNRAISDMIAGGEVTAEEMTNDQTME